jgi:hypothetical protein
MFLLNWYKEYLDIKNTQAAQAKELQYCEACETLKLQLAVANDERRFLLEKLTDNKPVIEQVVPESVILNPLHKSMRWTARRELLESEARDVAKRLRQNRENTTELKDVSKPLTVAAIEEELGVTADA